MSWTPDHRAVQVVVGAGLNGLMMADLLRTRGQVIVIESSRRIGGLLGSFDYGSHGRFDHGTHLLAETGDARLDEYLRGLLPGGDWVWLRGYRRNFAGLVFNGRIQTHTVYPDITTLPADEYRACMAGLPEVDRGSDSAVTAGDYLRRRYGSKIANEITAPIVEGFARAPVDDLHRMVTRFCPLDRLAMFDEAETHLMVGDVNLGRRMAFVHQRDLPVREQSPLASFYPRTRGIGQVVEALAGRLTESGVPVLTDTRIEAIVAKRGGIELSLGDGSVVQASQVFCSASPLAVAGSAGVPVPYQSMDRPMTAVLCHLVLDDAPGLGDVHYLQVADPGFSTYRYTNYNAFCPEGHQTGTPVTVELLIEGEADDEVLLTMALAEMAAIGVTEGPPRVQFSAVEVLPYGFPRPTMANVAAIAEVRSGIFDRLGDAFTLLGVGSSDDLFFMTDVLRSAYSACAGDRLRPDLTED